MVRYWDYSTTSTSTTQTASWWNSQSCSSATTYTTTSASTGGGGGASTWTCVYYVQPRAYLIDPPDHWDEATLASFVRLVNDETKTGFTVTMVIKGEILITDPHVERRAMADFVPLWKRYANAADRTKIDAFFAEFGAEGQP